MGSVLRFFVICAALLLGSFAAREAQAAITVAINVPSSGALVGDSLGVNVTINSTFQVTSVEATIGSLTSALAYTSGTSYGATLDLSALTSDNLTLTVTATDVYGASAADSRPVLLDRPPRSVLNSTLDGLVVSSSVHLNVSCVDENASTCAVTAHMGCSGLNGPYYDFSAMGTLDTMVDLSAIPVGSCTVNTSVTDEHNHHPPSDFYCFWHSARLGLIEVGRGPPGEILDFSTQSFLMYGGRVPPRVSDRATGVETFPFNGAGLTVGGCDPKRSQSDPYFYLSGYLGDQSAAILTGNAASRRVQYATPSASGAFATSPPPSGALVSFGRDRVAYNGGGQFSGNVLDMTTRTEYSVVNGRAPFVTPSGRVFYAGRFGGFYEWTPTSNGTFVSNSCADTGSELDEDFKLFCVSASGQRLYQSGWIAYLDGTGGGPPQVFTTSPTGDTAQVSFFGAGATIEALSFDGYVAMLVPTTPPSRWVGKAGAPPTEVDPNGAAVWKNGNFYVMMGRSLFRLASSCAVGDAECAWQPPPDPSVDAGAGVDGGAGVDAGTTKDVATVVDATTDTQDSDASDVGVASDAAPDVSSGGAGGGSAGSSGTTGGAPGLDAALDARGEVGPSGGTAGAGGRGSGGVAGAGAGSGGTMVGSAGAGAPPDDGASGGGCDGACGVARAPRGPAWSWAIALGLALHRQRRRSTKCRRAARERFPGL
jgi:hypothetical protein